MQRRFIEIQPHIVCHKSYELGCSYMPPSRLAWAFCFWSFFLDSFFLSGSSARAKACSFSTKVISMWQVALGYYIYITFLGYSSLNILNRTHFFLAPLSLFLILTLAMGWNLSRSLMDFYQYRVL